MTAALEIVVALLRDAAGRFYIQRRAESSHQGNRWEFPGGKCEAGESLPQALSRELQEECGVTPVDLWPWRQLEYDYGDRQVKLHLYLVRQWLGEVGSREGLNWRWSTADDLQQLDWPAANLRFIRDLDQLPD
ncbi:MAG: 8-oxo-dGTP diphosphatase MutT [Gammaproteobacteria bacterium]|nr:8-oxo-dGTP diphosphatase MutT [Gammaproteobacteria bacterium]